MAEPGAADAYEAARLAFELGRSVRQLREQHGWSQSELARQAGMTQSAVARFGAGGTVPTLPVLERLARAPGAELAVTFSPKATAAWNQQAHTLYSGTVSQVRSAANVCGVLTGEVAAALETAQRAFAVDDWPTAFASFQAVGEAAGLSADQRYALAESAWWLGEIDVALDAWKRAHDDYVALGDYARAAMSAMFLACHSMERGDAAAGSGWMHRTRRLLDDAPEGAAHGYPLYFQIFAEMVAGDLDAALSTAVEVGDIGRRFDDPNLVAISLVGTGRALLKRGSVADGMPVLDDAMLAAVAGRLHPVWAGAVYCHLMDACHELDDVRRAAEWTLAASRWCEGVPDTGVYRGICRVHRAQVLQIKGAWREAEREATQACRDMAHVHVGTIAEGHYEIGEIRRLRGDLTGAEEAFRRAHEAGRDPQPGLALVRLAQGQPETAAASIRTALAVLGGNPLPRARLCVAQVEIALAVGDLETARSACAELEQTAATYQSSGLAAAARQARGALLLREGAPAEAVIVLRAACRHWQDLDAKHHAASARLLLAEAYRGLGDEDAAQLELGAADAVFEHLGAEPGQRRVASLRGHVSPPAGMTDREVEVLRLVAKGYSNRDVASMLFISERTVHRHLSNVFTKLGVSSRTAATVYAFEHGIASPGG